MTVMKSIKEHPPQPDRQMSTPVHVPVLLESTLELLQPRPRDSYLDLTAGYGGHARRVLERTKNYKDSVLVDRDSLAIQSLGDLASQGVSLLETDFVLAARELISQGKTFDIILADLGVSSPQLDVAARGFSFQTDGPLDMRMDRRQERTAETIVNNYSKEQLTKIIAEYGEEPRAQARRIAEAIIKSRPLETTQQLATIIENISRRGGKRHPATRTFQALRIEVNQELSLIAELLPLLPKLLKKGGRVGVISFHSLEDRLVKQYFKEQAESGYEAELELVNKKPLKGAIYDAHNPRSRSAKLRVAVKK